MLNFLKISFALTGVLLCAVLQGCDDRGQSHGSALPLQPGRDEALPGDPLLQVRQDVLDLRPTGKSLLRLLNLANSPR